MASFSNTRGPNSPFQMLTVQAPAWILACTDIVFSLILVLLAAPSLKHQCPSSCTELRRPSPLPLPVLEGRNENGFHWQSTEHH